MSLRGEAGKRDGWLTGLKGHEALKLAFHRCLYSQDNSLTLYWRAVFNQMKRYVSGEYCEPSSLEVKH